MRLEQVVSNLVTNAVKYSAAGGHIRVRVSSEAACAQLEVSDDGIGMDAALLDHVFDVFVQASSSRDPRVFESS